MCIRSIKQGKTCHARMFLSGKHAGMTDDDRLRTPSTSNKEMPMALVVHRTEINFRHFVDRGSKLIT